MIAAATKPWIVGNLGLVAAFFGVQPSTVRGDWRQAGMPGSKGRWDLKEILQWYLDRPRKSMAPRAEAGAAGAVGRSALEEAELVEKVRCRRLKNDETEKQLIRVDEAQLEAAECFLRFKSRAESLPEQMATELPRRIRARTKRRWDHHVELMLRELAGLRLGGESGDSMILAAAVAIQAKRSEQEQPAA